VRPLVPLHTIRAWPSPTAHYQSIPSSTAHYQSMAMLSLKENLLQLNVNDLEKLSSKKESPLIKSSIWSCVGVYTTDSDETSDEDADARDDDQDEEDEEEDEDQQNEKIGRYVPWRSPSLARRVVQNVRHSPCLVRRALQNRRRKSSIKKRRELEIFSLALEVAHNSGQARNPWIKDKIDAWTSMGEDMSQYTDDFSEDESEEEDDYSSEERLDSWNCIQESASDNESDT